MKKIVIIIILAIFAFAGGLGLRSFMEKSNDSEQIINGGEAKLNGNKTEEQFIIDKKLYEQMSGQNATDILVYKKNDQLDQLFKQALSTIKDTKSDEYILWKAIFDIQEAMAVMAKPSIQTFGFKFKSKEEAMIMNNLFKTHANAGFTNDFTFSIKNKNYLILKSKIKKEGKLPVKLLPKYALGPLMEGNKEKKEVPMQKIPKSDLYKLLNEFNQEKYITLQISNAEGFKTYQVDTFFFSMLGQKFDYNPLLFLINSLNIVNLDFSHVDKTFMEKIIFYLRYEFSFNAEEPCPKDNINFLLKDKTIADKSIEINQNGIALYSFSMDKEKAVFNFEIKNIFNPDWKLLENILKRISTINSDFTYSLNTKTAGFELHVKINDFINKNINKYYKEIDEETEFMLDMFRIDLSKTVKDSFQKTGNYLSSKSLEDQIIVDMNNFNELKYYHYRNYKSQVGDNYKFGYTSLKNGYLFSVFKINDHGGLDLIRQKGELYGQEVIYPSLLSCLPKSSVDITKYLDKTEALDYINEKKYDFKLLNLDELIK